MSSKYTQIPMSEENRQAAASEGTAVENGKRNFRRNLCLPLMLTLRGGNGEKEMVGRKLCMDGHVTW